MSPKLVPPRVESEFLRLSLQALSLSMSVFGASLIHAGRVEAQALADPVAIALSASPGMALQMSPAVRAEVTQSLRQLADPELSRAYAGIHAAFRAWLGRDDLSVARALLDYASLAEAELRRRDLPHPDGTDSAAGMSIAYELVL